MKRDRKIKNKIFSKLLTLTGVLFAAALFLQVVQTSQVLLTAIKKFSP